MTLHIQSLQTTEGAIVGIGLLLIAGAWWLFSELWR